MFQLFAHPILSPSSLTNDGLTERFAVSDAVCSEPARVWSSEEGRAAHRPSSVPGEGSAEEVTSFHTTVFCDHLLLAVHAHLLIQ